MFGIKRKLQTLQELGHNFIQNETRLQIDCSKPIVYVATERRWPIMLSYADAR